MWQFNLLILAAKQIYRHPVRSILTILGVSTGTFLFLCVETMQSSLRQSTQADSADDTLVVFRKDRFCPFTSNLPEHYLPRIIKTDGVAAAIPVKVVVSNCGASLDVITFRGIPDNGLDFFSKEFTYLAGDEATWQTRRDAVILGSSAAARRHLRVGDTFETGGITSYVAAIIESPAAQDLNTAYAHLDFIQQSSGKGLGAVTQFNVRLSPGQSTTTVSEAIDAEFKSDTEPTHTRPEKAFFSQAARSIVSLVGFTHWVGLAAVAAVLILLTNTVMLAVRGRIRENAILQTVGYGRQELAWLVLVEGGILGILGGVIASVTTAATLHYGSFTLSSEGLSLVFALQVQVLWLGLGLSLGLGLVAAIFPAWQASHRDIVDALRLGG
ncbi:hypothetical protein BVY04_04025 [bacterium M21]|nr:hypothetical protein BVY04_04025 [bacterium M21]